MQVALQVKILNTKDYYKYLKENSFWIKELNRSHLNYHKFEEYLKDKYKLRLSDKITHAMDSVELVSNVLKALN